MNTSILHVLNISHDVTLLIDLFDAVHHIFESYRHYIVSRAQMWGNRLLIFYKIFQISNWNSPAATNWIAANFVHSALLQ